MRTCSIRFITILLLGLALMATPGTVASASTDTIKTVRLTLYGADCISSGAVADSLLRAIEGVMNVEIDIDTSIATISYDPSITDIDTIKQMMQDTDHPVTGSEPME